MPVSFDATLKDLARRHLGDYASTFHLGDASVIFAATDVVLGHGDPLRSIVDLNSRSGPEANLAGRICLYNRSLFLSLRRPCTQRRDPPAAAVLIRLLGAVIGLLFPVYTY